MPKNLNNKHPRTSCQRGGIEGKVLIVISLLMILSVGLMAWFSAPPEAVPEEGMEAVQPRSGD